MSDGAAPLRMQLRYPYPDLSFGSWRLRSWQVADAPALVAAWHDAEIATWNPVPADRTVGNAQGWIRGASDRLGAGSALDMVIVDDRDAVVGEIGLSGFDAVKRAALIGYWILPERRRNGVAAGAVRAVSTWAFSGDGLGLNVLVARCGRANLASQRVAASAGYVHVRSDGDDHELWAARAAR